VLRPDKQGNRRCDLPLKLQVGSLLDRRGR